MKRLLVCVTMSALALASVATFGLGISACADTDGAPPSSPEPIDGGDAGPPHDKSDAADPKPDSAAPEAGPRPCSYDGFCPTSLPPSQTLVGVWSDGAGVAWAVSTEGSVLRWDGNQWKVHASDVGSPRAVWGTGPTDIWIGGDRGILHGTGPSSEKVAFTAHRLPGVSPIIASIWGLSANDLWAVGAAYNDTGGLSGAVFHFTGGGENGDAWELAPGPPGMQAYSHVWGSAGSGVWIAGTRPNADMSWITELVVARMAGAGDRFTEIPLPGDPDDTGPLGAAGSASGAAAVSDSSIWIQGGSTTTRPLTWRGSTTDNGKTFTFTVERDGPRNAPRMNTLGGTAENDLWAAGDYGQARHWNGTKWTASAVTNTNLPLTISFYGVWARSPSEVWIVGQDIALRYDASKKSGGGQ